MSTNEREEGRQEVCPELMFRMANFHQKVTALIDNAVLFGISPEEVGHWLLIEHVCALKGYFDPQTLFALIVHQAAVTIEFYTGQTVMKDSPLH